MAIAILVSMLVAMTLIPAVLMLAGDRLFWPRKIYNTGGRKNKTGLAMKAISRGVMKHSGIVLAITLLLAVPAVWLYFQMDQGQDLVSMLPDRLESKVGFNMLDDNFGSGNIDRAKIVMTLPEPLEDADGNSSLAALNRIETISAMTAAVPGVDRVYSMTRPDGEPIDYGNLSNYPALQQAHYRTTMDNDTGADGHTTVISVAFRGSPYSEESDKAVDSIRGELAGYTAGDGAGISAS
jgi:RND superfamily putative drug exporter